MPQAYWIIPLEPGNIDNSLPGGRPPHVGGGPIYHPGHPDHGLPSQPGHPGNRPPGSWGGPVDPGWGGGGYPHPGGGPIFHPGHPDHGLPSNPAYPSNRPPGSGGGYPSGQPIPPGEITPLPVIPDEYADKVIVAVKKPDEEEWRVAAYDPNALPDNTLPPAPEPK